MDGLVRQFHSARVEKQEAVQDLGFVGLFVVQSLALDFTLTFALKGNLLFEGLGRGPPP